METSPYLSKLFAVSVAILGIFPGSVAAFAGDDGLSKVVDGLSVYIGVVPAQIVKGHPAGHPEQTMHGGPPAGQNEYHLVTAIFDAKTGERITDATVDAQIAPLALPGSTTRLEPMQIAGTITYGGYFSAAGRGRYTIKLAILRPGTPGPIKVDFQYERR